MSATTISWLCLEPLAELSRRPHPQLGTAAQALPFHNASLNKAWTVRQRSALCLSLGLPDHWAARRKSSRSGHRPGVAGPSVPRRPAYDDRGHVVLLFLACK